MELKGKYIFELKYVFTYYIYCVYARILLSEKVQSKALFDKKISNQKLH